MWDYFPLYYIFVKYYDPAVFANTKEDGNHVRQANEAVKEGEEFFEPFNQVVNLMSGIAGEFGRWLKACFCHEEALTSEASWSRRNRRSLGDTNDASGASEREQKPGNGMEYGEGDPSCPRAFDPVFRRACKPVQRTAKQPIHISRTSSHLSYRGCSP